MNSPAVKKKRVLYCLEDDSSLLAVYAISFSAEQYDFALFSSGTVALACMGSVFPDLLFLDLSLPDMDGFAFLEQVAARFPLAALPVVVVTGQSNAAAVYRAKGHNVTAFFVKPLTPDKIADFAEDYFALKNGSSNVVTKGLLDCLKRQEEISILNFDKFLKLEELDHQKDFFSHLARRGLVIDLGGLGMDFVSDLKNYIVLQQLYKHSKNTRKVKIFTEDEHVLRFLKNLGKFLKGDLFISRNAAVRSIRIDVEFGRED